MTSQSPRIYLYKITFEEVPYYYYGVHKEKYFNQEYWGSPISHKWCWEFYTPKKQILQVFPYTDEGWIEANEIEKRLISPVFNTDKWCLNENCGGNISLFVRKKNGEKSGKITAELKLGVHSRSPEQIREDGKMGGKVGGKIAKEFGKGIHGRTKEQHIEDGRKGGSISGKRNKELGLGIHGRTKEQMIEDGRKGGVIGAKIMNAQRWECCETGYVSTPAGVVSYQRIRGIDTSKSNRRRIS